MKGPIIYINSWPGVGKHTIAKELERQMEGKGRVVWPIFSSVIFVWRGGSLAVVYPHRAEKKRFFFILVFLKMQSLFVPSLLKKYMRLIFFFGSLGEYLSRLSAALSTF